MYKRLLNTFLKSIYPYIFIDRVEKGKNLTLTNFLGELNMFILGF